MKSKLRKAGVALLIAIVLVFLLLPMLMGMVLRGTVEEQISKNTNAPAKLGGLSVRLFPAGAVLSDLTLGDASPLAANKPLAHIGQMSVSVPYGVVLGGDLEVNGISVDGAEFHVGCDESGHSTLTAFLEKLPQSPKVRDKPLPLHELIVTSAQLFLHVPKKLMAPRSSKDPGPVQVSLGRLHVTDLQWPVPGKALPLEARVQLAIENVRVRAPINAVEDLASPKAAGEAMDAGITLGEALGQMTIPDSLEKPLLLDQLKLDRLQVRNVMIPEDMPDTVTRIHIARALCLRAPPPKKEIPGMSLGNGSAQVVDLKLTHSTIEWDGHDASGNLGYWRLKDFQIDISKLSMGPGVTTKADDPGHLKVSANGVSSEGEGALLLEWTNLSGQYPEWSFDKNFTLTGLPLTIFSSRLERSTKAKILKGQLASAFAGKTRQGQVEWDGSVTLSKDTKLEGEGIQGQATSYLSKFATGEPIKTIRVLGKIPALDVKAPDFVAGMFKSVFKNVLFDQEAGLFGALGSAMSATMGQGTRESGKLIDKSKDVLKTVPGVGGLFGGSEKKDE